VLNLEATNILEKSSSDVAIYRTEFATATRIEPGSNSVGQHPDRRTARGECPCMRFESFLRTRGSDNRLKIAMYRAGKGDAN
jgi:hypothetical protein